MKFANNGNPRDIVNNREAKSVFWMLAESVSLLGKQRRGSRGVGSPVHATGEESEKNTRRITLSRLRQAMSSPQRLQQGCR